MGKSGYINLIVSLLLLLIASILLVSSRMDPKALDSEIVFDSELHNSLWNLDIAKRKWVEGKHKSEDDIPTIKELAPYLEEWTNGIRRFETLGINYKITQLVETEPQSDVATLTRDVYFHAGFSRFYPAGTSYCIRTSWARPELSGTSRLRAIYFADRELLAVAIIFVTTVNLFILAVFKLFKKLRAH